MRADAQRNYERILAAAADAFAADGPEASLNDIARRAGIGPGTLYRHFPNRQALQAAIVGDRVDALCARADELAAADPDSALRQWLHAFLVHARTDHGLGGATLAGDDLGFDCHARIHDAAANMLARAQREGGARADVTPSQVIQLVVGIALAPARSDAAPDEPHRLLEIVIDGLYRGPST
ncbi:TetR/AcrR family transcriptional regulator [Nocardia cyriacigeorgica]|uniref:TetR/AcrR family transcriptional regulator n=1 Tax=Nocardia cyriacigeorgica TaxID=135487 RepID=A0A6P1DAG0_9NOCA|nr:TetR/AcrR family transcriptional regulator [Nocardia cyriacigeorgica]NEW41816.1 TetR/AcrR family transcriptional regulator [Nocardia cyriacigeorgica]NEW45860.1 TetR/AcrR family transcriptional regulator [Nocardia cyriacigeorgica]NEW52517.1 TetR/AcrR family transcriptional regulator [Nocardia cyriacigeorgica]NEW56766.1 TetR/AcrR family transcriptional regulator [Nocardia cyriacigeorgica]